MFFGGCHISLLFHVSKGFCANACAFEGAVTSVGLLRMTAVGKDLPPKVPAKAPACWGAASLVSGRAHWCTLRAVPSAKVSVSNNCGGLLRPIL